MRSRLIAVCLAFAALRAYGSITLIAPTPRVTLQGGQFATISWTADRAIDAEEWEAFLSVNGGAYYSVRLTPHLDLGIRTFQFLVPNIASNDVRILMRVGDERTETVIEFSQHFSIRASDSVELFRPYVAENAPEAARPGDAPVVQWASGSRDGGEVVVAYASLRVAELSSVCPQPPRTRPSAVLSPRCGARAHITSSVRAVGLVRPPSLEARSVDVLRLISRLNV